MLLKLGVDISRLSRPIRRALPVIEKEAVKIGVDPVITSTYEGPHSPGSLHYSNNAIDIRSRSFDDINKFMNALKTSMGNDYDIVYEGTHLHIEYDPKGK